MRLLAREIVPAVAGDFVSGDLQQSFGGVSTDSRTIRPGELFVPLAGQRYDGHDFIAEALQRGAAGFLTHRKNLPPASAVQIQVHDTLQSLGQLAAWALRTRLKTRVVAVAGSNGKTTTKELLAQILSPRFRTHATPGNLNSEIGLPWTILNSPEETEVLVLEMGTTARGDLKKLCAIAPPQIGVLTGIGEEHLATLGDLDGVLAAELELVENLQGSLIINGESDDLRRAVRAICRKPVLTFGLSAHHDYAAEAVEISRAGTRFRLCAPAGSVEIALKLCGRPAVYAALATTAVAQQLGLSLCEIAAGLARAHGAPGRLELLPQDALTILHDAYNANPASMREAILCAAQIRKSGEELIFVLGDMLELGARSAAAHREIGRLICEIRPDQLLVVGTWAQLIGDEAERANIVTLRFATAEAAADVLCQRLQEREQKKLVLLKGSRGMRLERVLGALQALEAV